MSRITSATSPHVLYRTSLKGFMFSQASNFTTKLKRIVLDWKNEIICEQGEAHTRLETNFDVLKL